MILSRLFTPFILFWIGVFHTRSSRVGSSEIFALILRRSWKEFKGKESSCFLLLGKERVVAGLDPYIRSLDTWKNSWLSCFSFHPCELASFFFFLSSASCLFFSTSFKVNTQAPWPFYWECNYVELFFFLCIGCQNFRIGTVQDNTISHSKPSCF